MIARMWRGRTAAADAADYADYVERTGIAGYRATPGNRGAWLLCRIDGDSAEFVTLSLWDSTEAIRAFAGPDHEAAVFYPEDDAWLTQRETRATHWEVVEGAPAL